MAIKLGDKPLADFTEPIEMMKDCHRRIEHFLDVLRKVEAQFGGGDLIDDARRALAASLDYFANSAPRHTADEEQSLFPRVRSSHNTAACEVLDELNRLESDHRRGEVCHALVNELVHQWLDSGHIDEVQRKKLRAVLDELEAMYTAHIRLEEQCVFPAASKILNADQVREIGEEMKTRRALS